MKILDNHQRDFDAVVIIKKKSISLIKENKLAKYNHSSYSSDIHSVLNLYKLFYYTHNIITYNDIILLLRIITHRTAARVVANNNVLYFYF